MLLAGLALAVFGWLAVQVLARGTLQFDLAIREAIHHYASPNLTHWMLAITRLGNWYVILAGVLVVLVYFLFKHRWQDARLLVLAIAGAMLLDNVLKLAFQRARPDAFFGFRAPTTYSFPSGHALVTLCFVGFVAGFIAMHVRRAWVRWAVWTAAVVIVGLVGLSRVYLGVHYPSDVMAGYAAAFAWMSAVGAVAQQEERARAGKSQQR